MRIKTKSIPYLFLLLSTFNACTLAELAERGHLSSKVHLTVATNTTLHSSGISPSAELGLYSIYDRYAYKGTKIFDFAEQFLVGYQNNIINRAPMMITSYSNNAGVLGFGLSHELENEHTERQYLGGKLMFFGPTHSTTLPHLFFEVLGYVGGRWSLYDDDSEALFGLSVRLHYQLNERVAKKRERTWRPPPPRPPLTPKQRHHMRMWRIKEIRKMMPRYKARKQLIDELERLVREEENYQDLLKASEAKNE